MALQEERAILRWGETTCLKAISGSSGANPQGLVNDAGGIRTPDGHQQLPRLSE